MTGRFKLVSAVVPAGVAVAMWVAAAGGSAANEPAAKGPASKGPAAHGSAAHGPVAHGPVAYSQMAYGPMAYGPANYGPPCAPPCGAPCNGCSPAEPCSPDGACYPKYDTFGWYPTRWRMFPGDYMSAKPTEAGRRPEGEEAEETLGGPLPPDSTRESQTGPEKPERAAAEGAPAAREQAAPAPGAEPAGAAPAEPVTPEPNFDAPVEDPLSYAPPTPPWMAESATPAVLEQPSSVAAGQSQVIEATAESPLPAKSAGDQDDAPPELPAGLRPLAPQAAARMMPVNGGAAIARPAAARGPALPPLASAGLAQPKSVTPSAKPAPAIDRRVVPASATNAATPQGIQFINPAGALGGSPTSQGSAAQADGPQQAIYFEASDWASDK